MSNRIKLTSGLPSGYRNQDVKEFLQLLEDVCRSLEILAQIQAATGGLGMTHRSGQTFEQHARLENFLRRLDIVESEE